MNNKVTCICRLVVKQSLLPLHTHTRAHTHRGIGNLQLCHYQPNPWCDISEHIKHCYIILSRSRSTHMNFTESMETTLSLCSCLCAHTSAHAYIVFLHALRAFTIHIVCALCVCGANNHCWVWECRMVQDSESPSGERLMWETANHPGVEVICGCRRHERLVVQFHSIYSTDTVITSRQRSCWRQIRVDKWVLFVIPHFTGDRASGYKSFWIEARNWCQTPVATSHATNQTWAGSTLIFRCFNNTVTFQPAVCCCFLFCPLLMSPLKSCQQSVLWFVINWTLSLDVPATMLTDWLPVSHI